MNTNANPYRCVIDKNGYYVTFVLMVENKDADGNIQYTPYMYELKPEESLVEISPPDSNIYAKPKLDINNQWCEGGTPTEIEEWEDAKPQPPNNFEPAITQRVSDLEDFVLLQMMGGEIPRG